MRRLAPLFVLAGLLSAEAAPPDPIQRLQQRLDRGEVALRFDNDGKGWLRSLLDALDIPVSSQSLVFSKTSAQFRLIRPESPRALYFNDEVYVGWVRGGPILEISAAAPGGAGVFYTLEQEPSARPRFVADDGTCLQCHESSRTLGVPGHLTRSVHPAPDGQPVLRLGSIDVDTRTALDQRFGGWYVTGKSLSPHWGNRWLDSFDSEDSLSPSAEPVALRTRFDVADYPAATSDVVAQLLLAHQTDLHNRIARAGVEARRAIEYRQDMTRLFGELSEETAASVQRRIQGPAEELVRGLLFVGEAPLPVRIEGDPEFRKVFEARGPLHELDLERRLLRHPLSYLILSESFDSLPPETLSYVGRRLREILVEGRSEAPIPALAATEREALVAILRQSKPGLLPQ